MTGEAARRGGEARSIGEQLGLARRAKARRTDQPVRRNSYDINDKRVQRFWRPISSRIAHAILDAAKLHDRAGKKPGQRNGPIGHVGLQVLELLVKTVRWKDGRLDLAIATMMTRLRRSRDAVVRALAALKREGFLDWMRRTEAVDAEGPGPRVRQLTNAYRLEVPANWAKRIRARVAQWAQRAGKPTDPPPGGRPAPAPDGPLAASLARLEAALLRSNASSPDGQNPDPAS